MDSRESPLVLALDTGDLRQALEWSLAAGEAAGMVKVGLELFGAEGPAAVAALAGQVVAARGGLASAGPVNREPPTLGAVA